MQPVHASQCVHWLQFDVLAGIAVGFTIVPQSLSYATITGVPAHMGLYGGFLPVITYAGGPC
jgi:sodium-independent sulfate anion transporter 11